MGTHYPGTKPIHLGGFVPRNSRHIKPGRDLSVHAAKDRGFVIPTSRRTECDRSRPVSMKGDDDHISQRQQSATTVSSAQIFGLEFPVHTRYSPGLAPAGIRMASGSGPLNPMSSSAMSFVSACCASGARWPPHPRRGGIRDSRCHRHVIRARRERHDSVHREKARRPSHPPTQRQARDESNLARSSPRYRLDPVTPSTIRAQEWPPASVHHDESSTFAPLRNAAPLSHRQLHTARVRA